jgi:hypothetical protein
LFSIRCDESIDAANVELLLVYIGYAHNDDIKTAFLFWKPLKTATARYRGMYVKRYPYIFKNKAFNKKLTWSLH